VRKLLILVLLASSAGVVHAQTSTTNCYNFGFSVQCTTTNPAQQQEQINQTFRNLGAAIAARQERKRQEKAAEEARRAADEARGRQEALEASLQQALNSDNAPAEPPPADEKPVLLACMVASGEPGGSVTLYEKHNRADVTMEGVTRTRVATFTTDAVTWTDAIMRVSLSRLDGSFVATGNIPATAGRRINGTCRITTARAF
jgi:hypothetical protein